MQNNLSPYIYAGYQCNNNCIFCSEADEYVQNLKRKSLQEIKKEVLQIRREHDFINIMGREPTLRDDIFDILSFTTSRNFKQVGLASNGRMFCHSEFTKDVLKTNINQIAISLAGASAATHDKQTRAPGSFRQTMAGIKNVLKYKKPQVSHLVNLPMNRLNYKELKAELKLLTALGVQEINILNISPVSRRSRSKKIIMPMPELSSYIFNTLKDNGFLGRKNPKILLVEFPPCSLPREGRKYFFPCLEKNPNKVKIPLCRSCAYVPRCDGLVNSYLDLYGSVNFRLN